MVSLADRAFHGGPDANWHVGIEIDPVVGQPDGTPGKAETIASVNAALDALREYYGIETFVYRHHNEFVQTSCGDDIHFEDYPQGIVIDPPPPGGVLDPAEYPHLFALQEELDRAFGEVPDGP